MAYTQKNINTIVEGVPSFDQLMWPTLLALKSLGGSGSIQEINDKIVELEGYSADVQQAPHKNGNQTKLAYNGAWSRTYLKKVNAIDNSGRGVWFLLDKGEALTELDIQKIPAEVRKAGKLSKEKNLGKVEVKVTPIDAFEGVDIGSWRDELLSVVQNIKPDAFERLCKRILRENGFTKVEVTGGSCDGGIDGIGILRINLLSFHVSFQCKRYQGSVGSKHIRDFRGAMVGRGDKGLFITTGNFTSEARKEASRDGAPAIDLIDGEELCDLLKDLKLGVETELIENVTINPDWFQSI